MPNSWPAIATCSVGAEEELYFPQIKQEFEANYVQSRKKATRNRKRWQLSWSAMTETDYQLLQAFFVANQGASFTWTHPTSGTNYTCIFSGDSIKSKIYTTNLRTDVQCPIEEL